MADLSALTSFLEDDGGFTTPPMPSVAHPGGKTYHVPSPDATTGLRLSALQDLALKQANGQDVSAADVKRLRLSDEDERVFVEQVLTPEVVAEMREDGCRWEHLKRLAIYGYILFTAGDKAAQHALDEGVLEGKAPAAAPKNRAARRAKPKAKTKATPTTGA